MASWFRSLWQKIKRHPIRTTLISIACVLGIVLLIGGYFFNWTWTGFGPYTLPNSNFQREKTFYDWLQLAIIPLVLAVGVWWLNRLQQQRDQRLADQRAQADHDAAERRAQTERDIAADNQREAAMKEYFDKMSELMLHENLSKSDSDDEVRKIARVLTLTVLRRCDEKRKAMVLQFLHESGLIEVGKRIVDLSGADLSNAYLTGADLVAADLSDANLTEAVLSKAALSRADLTRADLSRANLSGAILSRTIIIYTNFCEANLFEAILSPTRLDAKGIEERLKEAKSLTGTIMPDGSKHA